LQVLEKYFSEDLFFRHGEIIFGQFFFAYTPLKLFLSPTPMKPEPGRILKPY